MPAGWSASATSRPFLAAAASARALAASAARAGYRISILDLFGDSDLAPLVSHSAQLPRGRQGGFETRALLAAIARMAPASRRPKVGFVYGSGFEDRPELLAAIARRCVIFGNSLETLQLCKEPFAFAAVLDGLGLPRPGVRRDAPPARDSENWLVKRRGGAGGIHIRPAAKARAARGRYFQRRMSGIPVSATVLGDGRRAYVLGLAAPMTAPTSLMPFRFGGIAAPADIAPALAQELEAAAAAICARLKLRGLGSVDFIADGKRFWVIEVNPRPGASLEVFERILGTSLFDLHVRACAGKMPRQPLPRPRRRAAASLVLYLDAEHVMPAAFEWPDWSADRPRPGTVTGPNEPLCTVLAEGRTVNDAWNLALSRREALRARLWQCMQSTARQEAALPLHQGGKRQEGKPRDQTRRDQSSTA